MSIYQKDQLVWAKVKGYAWWPALVSKENTNAKGEIEKEVQVNFVGEDTHAVLSQDKVVNFQDKFDEFSKTKTKKLQEALKIALQLDKKRPKSVSKSEERKPTQSNRRSASTQSASQEPQKKGRGRPRKNLDNLQTLEPAPSAHHSKSRKRGNSMEIENESSKSKERRSSADARAQTVRKGRPKKQEKTEMEIEEPEVSAERHEVKRGRPRKAGKKEIEEERSQERGSLTSVRKPRSSGRDKKEEPKKEEKKNNAMELEAGALSKEKMDEIVFEELLKQRLTRSQAKRTSSDIFTEPAIKTSKKGRKEQMTKKKPVEKAEPAPVEEEILVKKPSATVVEEEKKPNLEFKQPAARPRHLIMERPQINLLRSINGEPSPHRKIEVTTRKLNMKGLNSAASKVGEKRPAASFWMKDAAGPTYLSNVKGRDFRNSQTELIIKKVKMSPMLQEKMSSIKATNIKDIQKPRNNIMKAMIAYNSLMIRKFETDLEQILAKLSTKFRAKEVMRDGDSDQMKLLNIISEFEKSQFNGSEFISSEVGKLFKTIQRLMINNRILLNSSGNTVIATLSRVIHQIKERIIRFCLDNSDYADAFDVSGESGDYFNNEAENIDQSKLKTEEFRPTSNKMVVEENQIKDIKKEEECRSSRSNSSFKEERSSSLNGSANKQPVTVVVRNETFKKLAKLIQENYFIDRTKAQDIALAMEEMTNKCCRELFTDYHQAMKVIQELIKNEMFSTEEFFRFKEMDVITFKNSLRVKARDQEDEHRDFEDYSRKNGKTESFLGFDENGFGGLKNSISKNFETVL